MTDDVVFELEDEHGPTRPLTRLGGDYWRYAIERGINANFAAQGFPVRVEWRIEGGYVYASRGSAPADESPPPPAPPAPSVSVRERWETLLWPELERTYAEFDAASLDGEDASEVWEAHWAKLERIFHIHFDVVFGAHQPIEALCRLYESLGGSRTDALAMIQGRSATTEALDRGLRRLADVARSNPADEALLCNDPPAFRVEGPFADALAAFLNDYGHRGNSGSDLTTPGWDEEPARLLVEVRKRLDQQSPRSDVGGRAEAATADARARLADRPDDLARFEEALAAALRDAPLTEDHAHFVDFMCAQRVRHLALRAGERLVSRNVSDDVGDVFHLHVDEVTKALTGSADLRALVIQRRAEHAAWGSVRPSKRLGGPAPERPEQPSDDVMQGVGASPGVARGPARVVNSAGDFASFSPGDVLVAQGTNPSYTPLIAIAAGVVTETGGLSSHAAVESRELGVPAVVGVRGARDLVEAGELIEVDGTKGEVRLRPSI